MSKYKQKLFDYLKNQIEDKSNSSEEMRINPSRLLDVFRSVNYKLSQSICDIIDNSIDAVGADTIEIYYSYDKVNHDRYLMIVDNGRGMTEPEIQNALMLGSDRQRDDKELGKFGIGLKLSALAQAKEITVISKPLDGKPQIRRISYDFIKKNKRLDLLKTLKDESLLEPITSYLDKYKSGTIVLLQDMDKRNRNFNSKDEQLRWAKESHHLKESIAMTYHRYLEGNNIINKKINILFNHMTLTPLDPMLLLFRANDDNPDGTLSHTVIAKKAEGQPKVALCIHPRRDILNESNEGKQMLDRLQKVEKSDMRNQGFYFYRNDRLITQGGWGYTFDDRTAHNSNNLARIVIDLKTEHDDSYDIDPTKTDYSPPDSFKETLFDMLHNNYSETGWGCSFIKMSVKRHKTKKLSKTLSNKKTSTKKDTNKGLKQTQPKSNPKARTTSIPQTTQLSLEFADMPNANALVYIDDFPPKIVVNRKHPYYDKFVTLFKEKINK